MKPIKNRSLKDDLSNYDKDAYEKPSVTVDISICAIIENDLKVLLVKRTNPPFRNCWAIPGGFVDVAQKETLEKTAARVLGKKTNLKKIYIEQLKTYGAPDRDPRMRIITVTYFALVPYDKISYQDIKGFDDTEEVDWFSLRKPPSGLAFDHADILEELLDRLKGKISYTPIAFNLVSEEFTWSDLQKVYEIILGTELLTPNFRRKLKELYFIEELPGKRKAKSPGRPPAFLKFNGIKELY
ncbi:MAG: NUDIX hydrolase [bacterium]|nr:NUDIX hydrolase [bacterium]